MFFRICGDEIRKFEWRDVVLKAGAFSSGRVQLVEGTRQQQPFARAVHEQAVDGFDIGDDPDQPLFRQHLAASDTGSIFALEEGFLSGMMR